MERYLISPRGIENEAGECITSGILAVFFLISGILSWRGYLNNGAKDPGYLSKYYKGRMTRLLPLFFISLTSFFIAGFFTEALRIDFFQYMVTLVGFGWLFQPMVPTLWFCSILIFFIEIAGIVFTIQNYKLRITVIILIYAILLAFYWFKPIDIRILYYYPFFFSPFFNGNKSIKWKKIVIEKKNKYWLILFGAILSLGLWTLLLWMHLSEVLLPIRDNLVIQVGGSIIRNTFLSSFIVGMSLLFEKIKIVPFSKMIRLGAYSSFCVYLFHRQFYELLIIVFGKIDRLFGWISIIVFFIFCGFLQRGYSFIVEKMSHNQ